MSQRGRPGSVYINATQAIGCTRIRVATGLQFQRTFGGDGAIDPVHAALLDATPVVEFDTMDVAAMLALNSSTFWTRGVGITSFSAFCRNLTADGTVASTGDLYALTNGLIIPQRLRSGHKQIAVLSCLAIGRSADKTTAALSRTADQAVQAAPTPVRYVTGQIEANGTALGEVQSLDADPGIRVRGPLGGDGQPYSDALGVDACEPSFSVVIHDMDAFATITPGAGLRQSATDSELYLRKLDPAGTRIAAGTAEHIKFSIAGNGSPMWIDEIAGDDGTVAALRVTYWPIIESGTAIVVVSTTSAIA